MDKLILECQCADPAHIMQLRYDEEDKELYTDLRMNNYRGFWARLWIATKYVLGIDTNFHWDSVVLSGKELDKLKQFLKDK